MTQSLKAVKKAITSPSKAELVLADNVKLALAPIVSEASSAYQFGLDYEKLVMTKQEKEQEFAYHFVSYVKDNKLDYAHYQAVKKHIQQSIATSKKQEFKTVEIWLNRIVKECIKAGDFAGYTLPTSEKRSAVAMSELRAELASISDSELVSQIAELAKQGASGDKQALKRATQLASEKQKRETQAQNAIKRADSKNATELKTALKKWVTGMDTEQLAALVWAKNHFSQVVKLSKS